jgi:hypothetical protein
MRTIPSSVDKAAGALDAAPPWKPHSASDDYRRTSPTAEEMQRHGGSLKDLPLTGEGKNQPIVFV